MENDILLIKEWQAGSISAFEKVVKIYREQIYKLAYQIIGDFEDASDISQEVFIRAYKSINTFRGDASLSTWLRKIAINLSINHIRRESRYKMKSRGIIKNRDNKSFSGYIMTPLDIVEKKELINKVNESIRALPLEERIVFVLRVQQGLSYREIAESVRCPQGTVMSRLNRARRRLRDKLKDYMV